MGKGSHVPEYSSATVKNDIFGSSTADKNGVTINATPWQTKLSNTVTGYLVPNVKKMQKTLNSITSRDYLNDANFKTYKADFDRQAADTFDTAVLGNLADRGLLGSSGIQALNDSYQNAMNNNLTNLMKDYRNDLVSDYGLLNTNLGSLLNTENTLYGWLTGIGNMAQSQANAVSNYNAKKAEIENQGRSNLWGQLMGAGASVGGGALGSMIAPGVGTAIGSSLGGMLGSSGGSALGSGDLSVMGALQNAVPMTSFQSSIMGY